MYFLIFPMSRVCIYSTLLNTEKWFSEVVVPIYTPIEQYMGVSVVPILTPACDFTKAVNDIFIFLVHSWLEKQ